jgi:hypothetical protein
MCVLAAALLAWSLRHGVQPDPAQAAWLRFCRKLGARGVARAPHEGPSDFAQRAISGAPTSSSAIRRISDLYIALRYGKERAPADVAELRRLVREFRAA